MNPAEIDQLARLLARRLADASSPRPAPGPTPLSATLASLRRRAAMGAPPSPHRTRIVYRFLLDGKIASFADLLTLCGAAGTASGWDGRRLLDETRRFPLLLDAAGRLTDHRQFCRCYRALLASYLAYPIDASERSNEGMRQWQDLRSFLLHHRPAVENGGNEPWIACLQRNAPLLDDPGKAPMVDIETRRLLRIADNAWPCRPRGVEVT